jgi:hypothetical protein
VHSSYVGSDRFGRLRGALGTPAADRDLDAGRVSRFRDLKAETGGPPNDDEMTVSCGHEPSCVCRFCQDLKLFLITRATTVKFFSFVAIARCDVRQFCAAFNDSLTSFGPKIRIILAGT